MNAELGEFGAQSALRAFGPNAEAALLLTVVMSVAGIVILAIVMGLVWLAVRRTGRPRSWWIWAGGIVWPLATILVLFVFSTITLRAIARTDDTAFVIEVTGHQYWWDVVYDPDGRAIRDANEIWVPVGEPVTFRLVTDDVIHSFWVPSLAGKMDMIPGRTNAFTMVASEPGRYRGQCAEFCGLSHPQMAFEVVAVPPDRFAAFLDELQGEARDAARPELLAGKQVFLEAGCAACHQIRGVAEGAMVGPDLTRVGGRAALGAGMWRMNKGNLAGWIADVGDMKPGAQMPNYNHLSGPDLRALAAYLESLT
ncbi:MULTISPECIES: cytochrome c oxidase subunit II [unclassified Roseitalea]|uniref:cytochrome c oxidase subunit II n=1 Tax=unclassified Roseitalea TaxID=2639107 RepID=UPI00273E97C2|nr:MULTISPECIES: cytochrome c oxidase subunit II [unclassified Roseitalea]